MYLEGRFEGLGDTLLTFKAILSSKLYLRMIIDFYLRNHTGVFDTPRFISAITSLQKYCKEQS